VARENAKVSATALQMQADATVAGCVMRLTGRGAERGMLDQFVGAIRSGESRALVLSGEAGVGKTALLEYWTAR
jgi:GTPase SAR1 family protein